jgi:hypothetical protein
MRSKWVTHKDKQIFYQDFSGYNLLESDAAKAELCAVQEIVCSQPNNSVLVLSDFRETQIGKDLMDLMVASSRQMKLHVNKTALLGITGTKRILVDMLARLTDQQLTLFDTEEEAIEWLVSPNVPDLSVVKDETLVQKSRKPSIGFAE